MDAKVTLSFDQDVIHAAKAFAEKNNISLSRLTEFLLRQITSDQYSSIEDLPIADWISVVAEGEAEYRTKPRKISKTDFYEKK
ncbi:MAG: tRNA threonylcarbamoyladenosine modification (KEOPS) complex Cgi121 subunit [Roseivirga sp.]|jgi:tRNA threonylcarbamoyladenosine modification (KEOPS) complex Cgi121 subunit